MTHCIGSSWGPAEMWRVQRRSCEDSYQGIRMFWAESHRVFFVSIWEMGGFGIECRLVHLRLKLKQADLRLF